ncbi:N2227-like protein-domain-containing protein [Melampsora americana]|nr:N2227-like protein-domain-containing protein [Melampsora americana]
MTAQNVLETNDAEKMLEDVPRTPAGGSSSSDLNSESAYYRKIVKSFDEYRRWSLTANTRRKKDFYRIPLADQHLLPNYIKKLNEVDDRIRRNADVLDEIIFKAEEAGIGPYNPTPSSPSGLVGQKLELGNSAEKVTSFEADKVKSTLRQFVRDWSVLGAPERDACYEPMLIALDSYAEQLLPEGIDRRQIRVLVPGCGLGRLAWEVADRGKLFQPNPYGTIVATCIDQWSIYPFIHSLSNQTCQEDLLSEVKFPDKMSSIKFNAEDFGISMGDFTEIFTKPEEKGLRVLGNGSNNWNVILTCFFIDTAKNIVEYLRTIHHLLKPGGMWVNLGPTLWHYEGSSNPMDTSIELDVNEIKSLCQQMGFEFDPNYVRIR